MSDQQTPLPAAPAEDPQVTIKNLQDQIGSLEEQARLAAEAHAADMNTITELRTANEELRKEVDSKWEAELKRVSKKIGGGK